LSHFLLDTKNDLDNDAIAKLIWPMAKGATEKEESHAQIKASQLLNWRNSPVRGISD
jgi:hypothetical protein